jgi:hypothetical protein
MTHLFISMVKSILRVKAVYIAASIVLHSHNIMLMN